MKAKDLGKLQEVDPELKKKQSTFKKLTTDMPCDLERVIGCSTKSNFSIAVNSETGDIAYPAGSIIIIYKPKENKQVAFLTNKNNKSYNCLAYSSDGKMLAASEGTTRQPEITIWKIEPVS